MIQQTERFQTDIKKYQEEISKIKNEKAKNEANFLLNNLIAEVRKIDSLYMDMVYTNRLNSTGKEFRDNLTQLRMKLDSKIKENKGD